MKEHTLANRRIKDCLDGLRLVSKPHPQTTTDGKTVTRPFEMHPKARVLLTQAASILEEHAERFVKRERELNLALIPKGVANHTPEERGVFQKAFEELMDETQTFALPQLLLHCEKTDKPDAIDFSKAPIPYHYLVDLFGVVVVDADPDTRPLHPVTLDNWKLHRCLTSMISLSKPGLHTMGDGKTVTRDYDIPARARRDLLSAMATMKKVFDAKDAQRLACMMEHTPSGTENHSPEEVAEFSKKFDSLMSETFTIHLPKVFLYYDKTEKTDGIDLSKAPVPFEYMSPLLNVVLFESDADISETKPTRTEDGAKG